MKAPGRRWHGVAAGSAVILWMAATVAAQSAQGGASGLPPLSPNDMSEGLREGVSQAAMRLPLAAGLGALLALRPRRAGSPPKDWAVIQTQIVLAIVGALIMIIVGASLARAFGIAGAANLIRYRAKIEDPKDAVVMLSTLSVGLACGVGVFGIAAVGTVFLVVTLWVIEGFETRVRTFLLTVKLGEDTASKQGAVERLLKKAGTVFELRSTGEEGLSYVVDAGRSLKTEPLSLALAALAPDGKGQVEWKEEKKARPLADSEEEE